MAGVDLYDGIKNDYPVFPNISVCDVKADVIIDFSNAKAVDDLLVYSVDKKIPVVLCTTGLSEEQMEQVKAASGQVAVLKSANMSLGINLLMQLLAQAPTFPQIEEMFKIFPDFWWIMCGRASLLAEKTEVRLTPMMRFHSSMVISSSRPICEMPALFTRMSMPPKRASLWEKSCSI